MLLPYYHARTFADGSGSIDLKELIHRRVEDVERAYKEDAAEMAENLVEGGLGIIKVHSGLG